MLVSTTVDRGRFSPTSARSSSTRCTRSPGTTGAGTCWRCWSGSRTGRPPGPADRAVGDRRQPGDLLPGCRGRAPDRPRVPWSRRLGSPHASSDVTLDHVGSLDDAAKVIAALHRGEKRLVFVDSRRRAEELGTALRHREVVDVPVALVAVGGRAARAEEAFAEARDCVIVATSTLELGIDVGDLDRVIQSVRRARSRRSSSGSAAPGGGRDSVRNCLFLGLERRGAAGGRTADRVVAAGWSRCSRRRSPATSPPSSCWRWHCGGRRSAADVARLVEGAPMLDGGAEVLRICSTRASSRATADLASSGPRPSSRSAGATSWSCWRSSPRRRSSPCCTGGARSARSVRRAVADMAGPGAVLAGRAWRVTYVDWKRRRCFVEPTDLPGRARWSGTGGGLSFEITRGCATSSWAPTRRE